MAIKAKKKKILEKKRNIETTKKIKKKSVKKQIRDLPISKKKIVKVKKDESELEETIEDFDENKFVEFLQPSIESVTPVLEKVASADDLIDLSRGFVVQTPGSREKEQEDEINYSTTNQNYDSSGRTDEGEQRNNNSAYAGPSVNYSFEQTEEGEETRRLVGQGDMSQRSKRNDRFEMEKQNFVKPDKDTKKYVGKGDFK
tara:strand:- start:28 stop:627 length:600 start_codon:yes stop_codon:yes gene_type:complete